jgi:quercetin dioxygenase-like cupin family protein
MRHNGTEYGYILAGRLEISLGFDKYEIGPGDSIAFDCTQPHRFATVGDETVEAVWFVVGRRNTLSVDDSPSVDDASSVAP